MTRPVPRYWRLCEIAVMCGIRPASVLREVSRSRAEKAVTGSWPTDPVRRTRHGGSLRPRVPAPDGEETRPPGRKGSGGELFWDSTRTDVVVFVEALLPTYLKCADMSGRVSPDNDSPAKDQS